MTFVCPDKDIVCGDRPGNWCDVCPLRQSKSPAPHFRVEAAADAVSKALSNLVFVVERCVANHSHGFLGIALDNARFALERRVAPAASKVSYEGLRFSIALHRFMCTLNDPLAPPDIAKGFEASGWIFSNKQPNNKVNQVGVTLRRGKGMLFDECSKGLWIANPISEGRTS